MQRQIHLISTGQQTKEIFIEKVIAVHEEIDFIHIREKFWTAMEIIDTVNILVQYGVPLGKIIINDRIDIAASIHARGVQLTSHSVSIHYVKKHHPNLLVGCSVHDVSEAIDKEKAGADYLLYGHIFKTDSKKGAPPRGVNSLMSIREQVSIPIIAIGGITPDTVSTVVKAGANGIAVLSGILLEKDVVEAARKYKRALEGLE